MHLSTERRYDFLMQFSLRSLLIVLAIAPPILAALLYLFSWEWTVVFCVLSLYSAMTIVLFEMGSFLRWLLRKQIADDKARIARKAETKDI